MSDEIFERNIYVIHFPIAIDTTKRLFRNWEFCSTSQFSVDVNNGKLHTTIKYIRDYNDSSQLITGTKCQLQNESQSFEKYFSDLKHI